MGGVVGLSTAQLVANISVVGAKEAETALQSVSDKTDKAGGILKSALGGALGIAAGVGSVAVKGLTDVLSDSVKVAMQHQQVMAQTTEVVKSTASAAGMSAKAIDDLGASLSRTTTFSHDSIQAGENLMLTFTGIGKKVFPEATQAMLDLSQATGQSLKSSAIQLGKALNDPLTGLNALARVGVSFSDQEKQQIKTMMAHHDVMGAQKVMLKELETEFGGSAAAAGKTFAGQMQILNNVMEDTKEKIGTALLPIINQFMSFVASVGLPIIQKLSDWFSTVAVGAIQHFIAQLGKLSPLFTFLQGLGTSVFKQIGDILWQIGEVSKNVADRLGLIGVKMGDMNGIVNKAKQIASQLYEPFHHAMNNIEIALGSINPDKVASGIKGLMSHMDFKPLIDGAKNVAGLIGEALSHIDFKTIISDVKTFGQIFLNISPAVNLMQALASHAQELGKWFNTSVIPALKGTEPGFKNLMQALQGLIPAALTISNVIHDFFQKAFNDLLPIFMKIIPIIIELTGYIANGLGIAIKFLTPYVVQAATAIGQFASDILQRVSPIILQFFNNLQVALDWLKQYWPQIWSTLAPFLLSVWNTLTGIVKIAWALLTGIINIGLDVLSGNWTQAWTDMKNMLGGIWNGVKDVIKGGIDGMIGVLNLGIDALNAFIDAVENALNSAAKAMGLGSPIPITTIPLIPAYSSGTDSHPGGAALVGEKGPEIAILPKGTSVIPAGLTKSILAGIPAYADGTGNILDNLTSWATSGAQSVLDNLLKGLSLHLNLGEMSNLGTGIMNKIKDWALDWIKSKLMPKMPSSGGGSAGPGTPVNLPGDLASWIMAAIGLTGVPANWANDLGIIAMHESGGNPNAINNWDINAQEGHPSQGIMQTIPSTFAAYMVPGHGNILNPIDNIAAAIGYIKSRYGSVFNVPGIVSMSNGGAYQGYANGTNYAEGGVAWVGERGPERMYIPRGAQITPHEVLTKAAQQPQIVVNPPAIYLDGQMIANNQLPYIVNAIRYNTGINTL